MIGNEFIVTIGHTDEPDRVIGEVNECLRDFNLEFDLEWRDRDKYQYCYKLKQRLSDTRTQLFL